MKCKCGVKLVWRDHGVCAKCDRWNLLVVLLLAAFLREHHYGREADILARSADGASFAARKAA